MPPLGGIRVKLLEICPMLSRQNRPCCPPFQFHTMQLLWNGTVQYKIDCSTLTEEISGNLTRFKLSNFDTFGILTPDRQTLHYPGSVHHGGEYV